MKTSEPMDKDQRAIAFDMLEDALIAGFPVNEDLMVDVGDLEALMETARAVLVIERGVEPIMPRGAPA